MSSPNAARSVPAHIHTSLQSVIDMLQQLIVTRPNCIPRLERIVRVMFTGNKGRSRNRLKALSTC
jgi:hypothetical protein